jgi:uncharacterized C2H2 Zn-finger protein
MSDLTAALHARRADLHATIRQHADEIADIDRLLVRYDPRVEVVYIDLDTGAFTAAAPAALQNDDGPPADVPHVEPAPVAEAGVEPAPDGVPRPSLDIAETRPTGGRRQSPRPSDRGEPDLPCDHCDRVFPTKQARATHITRTHPEARDAARTPAPPASKPTGNGKSPVQMPAEGGRVVRCSACGWQTAPSYVRDLAKHTHLEHDRAPDRSERTPIIDERAA